MGLITNGLDVTIVVEPSPTAVPFVTALLMILGSALYVGATGPMQLTLGAFLIGVSVGVIMREVTYGKG